MLDPLVAEHEEELIAAKALTNAFRGPGGADAIRERLVQSAGRSSIVRDKLATLEDETIERIRAALSAADRRWRSVPPGGRLELRWPSTLVA
jgi:hypothetical protein